MIDHDFTVTTVDAGVSVTLTPRPGTAGQAVVTTIVVNSAAAGTGKLQDGQNVVVRIG